MANVTVVAHGAVIDGNPVGSTLIMDETQALKLERLGYVRIVETIVDQPSEDAPLKKESAPKKTDDAPKKKTATKKK